MDVVLYAVVVAEGQFVSVATTAKHNFFLSNTSPGQAGLPEHFLVTTQLTPVTPVHLELIQ